MPGIKSSSVKGTQVIFSLKERNAIWVAHDAAAWLLARLHVDDPGRQHCDDAREALANVADHFGIPKPPEKKSAV